MSPHQGRGRFITFEGADGAGKSVQAARLAKRLETLGVEVVETREPGGSPQAEALRDLLLSGGASDFGPTGEALLFAAARIDHIDKTIGPALARGAWVISDRFADSTRAYQGAAGNVDRELIATLERVVVGDCKPDLTIVLDAPIEVARARAEARRKDRVADRFEQEGAAFQRALREAFLKIAREEPGRCAVVDASRNEAEVSEAVWRIVSERLGAFLPATARAP